MEDDDVARLELVEHPARGLLGRQAPVARHLRVPDLVARQVADGGTHTLVAAQERGAPVARRPAERFRDDLDGAGRLVSDLVVRQRLEVEMSDGVGADVVTCAGDPPHDLCATGRRDGVAEDEERSAAAKPLQLLGDRHRPRCRPVVERQRDDGRGDPTASFDESHEAIVRAAMTYAPPLRTYV